jgi:hypothetical protein
VTREGSRKDPFDYYPLDAQTDAEAVASYRRRNR